MSDRKIKSIKAASMKRRASKASRTRGSYLKSNASPTRASEIEIVKPVDVEPPKVKTKETKTMYVLKKRKSFLPVDSHRNTFFDERKSSKFSDIKFVKNTDMLSVEAISPETMTWRHITRSSPEPWKIIHRQPHYDRLYHYNLDKSLRLEKSSLKMFQEMKKLQLKTENYLMEKTGKLRGGLLLRRKQLLPKIGVKGDETDLLLLEKTLRPKNVPATNLFVYDKYNAMLKKGILPVISNKDRGFTESREWIGCPDVTDYILEDLHLHHRHVGDEQFSFEEKKCDDSQTFTPHIPMLGVRASKIHRHTRRSVKIDAQSNTSIGRRSKDKRFKPHESVFRDKHYLGGSVLDESESVLALKFGDKLLEWTTDRERSLQTLVVGVGCWAQHGRKGIGSINMTNVGTTAIYFHFEKNVCPNTLISTPPEHQKFVFDSWGGSILPNEVYRIPFLYNASTLGIFSEDWRLLTKPVLESGAKILLRLTGITRHSDEYSHHDLTIDQNLQKRNNVMFARQFVEDLVKYLPVLQFSFKDTLFANVCKGMDMFLLLNPGFHYTTAPVFRLGKLMDIMQRRRSIREEMFAEEPVADIQVSKESELTISHEYTEEMEYEDFYGEEFEERSDDASEEVLANASRRFSVKPYLSLQRKSQFEVNPITVLYARLDPDNENLKVFTYDPVHTASWGSVNEDGAAKSATLVDAGSQDVVQRRIYPKAPVNLANTELKIDALREYIYNDLSTAEMQNAHFTVFYREVEKLCFRPWHAPGMNVKYLIARTQLCSLLDTFSDRVAKFKTSCFLELKLSNLLPDSISYPPEPLSNGPTEQIMKTMSVPTNSFSVTGAKSLMRLKEIKSIFDSSKLWRALSERKIIPKDRPEVIDYINQDSLIETKDEAKIIQRRANIYMPMLYGTMFSLLSDFLDQLDTLFYSLPKSNEKPNRPEIFMNVSNIPMPNKIESLVYVKKPDTYWVKVAKKMNEVASMMPKKVKSVTFPESSHTQNVLNKSSTSTVRSGGSVQHDQDQEHRDRDKEEVRSRSVGGRN